MFKKLHLKLTVYMGVILCLFMIMVTFGIYNFTRYVYNEQTESLMQDEFYKIRSEELKEDQIEKELNYFLSDDIKLNVISFSRKISCQYIYYDSNMDVVKSDFADSTVVDVLKRRASEAFENKKSSYTVMDVNGVDFRLLTEYFIVDGKPYVIEVFQNVGEEMYIWNFLKSILFIIGFFGIIALIIISYFFTGKAIKPINETWIKQKEFIADASHELRTPLTVIRTNLDVLKEDENGKITDNIMWLDNAYSETKVMSGLIDQMLTLAKVDSNQETIEYMEVSLSEVVENVIKNMELVAESKGLEFHSSIEPDLIIMADYDKIRRLILILLDNAVKYTEKGFVEVSLFREKGKIVLKVIDSGIGIASEELPRVFDRFYRSDKARNRKLGGTGLGLSIAKWITDEHKASICVKSKLGEGSTFTVKF